VNESRAPKTKAALIAELASRGLPMTIVVGPGKKAARKHRAKAGWIHYDDGRKFYFRSQLEATFAMGLEVQRMGGAIRDWAHEPRRFHFPDQKIGATGYSPDFLVTGLDGSETWTECKGFWTSKDTEKLRKCARHYPEIVIQIHGAPLPAKAKARIEAARALTLRERAKAEKKVGRHDQG
jgi:hypothetical protein